MNKLEVFRGAVAIYDADNPEFELNQLGAVSSHKVENRVRWRPGRRKPSLFDLVLGAMDNQPLRNVDHEQYDIVHHYKWEFGHTLPFSAKFAPEGFDKKLAKFFKDEPEVGDPLFDDRVYITTDNPESCLATLSERCQASIMSIVQQGGVVVVEGNELNIELVEEDVSGYSSEFLHDQFVIAAHFVQWAKA